MMSMHGVWLLYAYEMILVYDIRECTYSTKPTKNLTSTLCAKLETSVFLTIGFFIVLGG